MADPRLKGQEISIRVIQAGSVVNTISAVASFNDSVMLEIKEDGFLGEPVNRFDNVLNGYSGDFEFQPSTAHWLEFVQSAEAKARREQPALIFNIVRTDFFANGETAIITYSDVSFGAIPTSIPAKNDFVKAKMEFKCGERTIQVNAIA